MPSKRPAYRADRPHGDFLTDVASQLPAERRSPAHFAHAMRAQLAGQFQVQMQDSAGDCALDNDADMDIGTAQSMPVIENADFQDLHERLKALNPAFSPRTYFIEDLPSE